MMYMDGDISFESKMGDGSNPGGGLTLSTASSGGYKVTSITAGTGNVSWS